MHKLTLALSCSLALLLPACGGHDHDHSGGGGGGNTASGTMDGHGARHELGTLTIAGFEFTAVLLGELAPGKEAVAQAEFAAGKPMPKTMRAWVGVESGQGSMKQRLSKEGDTALHAHFQAPKEFAENYQVWFEIEHDGKTERAAIKLP